MKRPSTFSILTGLLFIAVGIFFLVNPVAALKMMVIVAGIVAVVKGLLDIMRFFRTKKQTNKNDYSILFSGVLILLIGILLFFNTTFGIVFTGTIFAIWFFFESLSTILSLRFFKEKKGVAFFILLILGILSLALSILMFIRPFYAAFSFTIITGVYFIAQGIVMVLIALNFRTWFKEAEK